MPTQPQWHEQVMCLAARGPTLGAASASSAPTPSSHPRVSVEKYASVCSCDVNQHDQANETPTSPPTTAITSALFCGASADPPRTRRTASNTMASSAGHAR